MNIIKEVRAAWVAREIKRLMPVSSKTEPVVQRRRVALLVCEDATWSAWDAEIRPLQFNEDRVPAESRTRVSSFKGEQA